MNKFCTCHKALLIFSDRDTETSYSLSVEFRVLQRVPILSSNLTAIRCTAILENVVFRHHGGLIMGSTNLLGTILPWCSRSFRGLSIRYHIMPRVDSLWVILTSISNEIETLHWINKSKSRIGVGVFYLLVKSYNDQVFVLVSFHMERNMIVLTISSKMKI